MKTIKCVICHQKHALFWWVNGKGKKELAFTCNQVPVTATQASGEVATHTGTQTRTLGDAQMTKKLEGNLEVAEVWSRDWAKKQQAKKQMNLL